jgi:flagellin-like hook-associated protein FlgL
LGLMDVVWQGTTYSVDFSGATTLGDLVAGFNATVPGMELEVRDSSIVLITGSPESFEVFNADATDTASALGVAGSGSPVRLFGMLEDLKTALENGDKDAIRGAINELTSIEDTIYQLMMRNGGRQTDLDWADSTLRQRDERLRSNLSLEYDADVAEVASELSRAESTYQASLLVTSRLYESNLMMYLR